MTRVLIAEDDAPLRRLLSEVLVDAGFEVHAVGDGRSAIAALAAGCDAVLSDVNMPGADGMAVVQAARRRDPPVPVVLLTGFGTIAGAVEAMRAGAFDYLTKPIESPAALRALIARAIASTGAPSTAEPPGKTPPDGDGDDFVAADPASAPLVELIDRVAARDTTVLLLGESGVGKEVIARRIHARSRRKGSRFVAVNCGAIPHELFEGQVFGHAKGAFSGAASAHRGFFEEAHGGTLLLDEVGELPLPAQVKLLRALEERRITRLGESREVPVDARVIAATNRRLDEEARAGRFREDLYFRLSVFPIRIPPLRERRGDIVPLGRSILRRLGEGGRALTDEARGALAAHGWPGNVRELRNVLERAVIIAGDGPIDARHLGLAAAGPAPAEAGPVTLSDLERQAIVDALQASGGNRRMAAERLGIALRTLQYKLKELGLIKRT